MPFRDFDPANVSQALKRLEQVSVAEPENLRRLFLIDVGLFGSLLVTLAIGWSTDNNVVDAITGTSLLVIIMVAWWFLRSTVRSRAYRNGYLDGRAQMIASITEAMMRGMTPEEWVRLEVERDEKVIRHI
jgi:hypothetical protein